jgi:hypothetical protein
VTYIQKAASGIAAAASALWSDPPRKASPRGIHLVRKSGGVAEGKVTGGNHVNVERMAERDFGGVEGNRSIHCHEAERADKNSVIYWELLNIGYCCCSCS